MKLVEQVNDVVRSDVFEEGVFKIQQSAKAFEILSSKIYTNPIAAIIRELSTNAHDAHVEVGKADVPFNVHMPNYMEGFFSIRDFGPGISPEKIKEIYTVYFSSTRNQSNEFAGCLGLGSKSPFSYTDQFSVTSYYNGRKYVYSLFKNEANCPSVALLADTETTEPNGLEIKINVREHDRHTFVIQAQAIYQFFKVWPTVVGANLERVADKPILTGKGYALYNETNRLPQQISVVMGQVCYGAGRKKDGSVRALFNNNTRLLLFMDIGACSVSASREELQYDAPTEAAISEAVKNAVADIKRQIDEKLATASTKLALLKMAVQFDTMHNIRLPTLPLFMQNEYDMDRIRRHGYKNKTVFPVFAPEKSTGSLSYDDLRYYHYEIIIVENDSGNNRYIKYRPNLLELQHKNQNARIYIVNITDRKKFEETFGVPDYKMTQLPAPANPTAITEAVRPKYYILKKLDNLDNWVAADKIEDAANSAIVKRDYKHSWCPVKQVWRDNRLTRQIAGLIDIKNVYSVPAGEYEKFAKSSKLPNLFELAKTELAAKLNKLNTYELSYIGHEFPHINKCVKELATISAEADDLCKLIKAAADFTRRELWIRALGVFDIKLPPHENYIENFFKKYPLIRCLDQYADWPKTEIVDYVKLVNTKGVK